MIKILEKQKPISIIITILIAIQIFYFSSLTFGQTNPGKYFLFLPIAYHFIVFFLLTFFLTSSIKNPKLNLTQKQILLIIGISLIYAISDEIHQLFVPGRFFSINDIIINLTGIICAILIYPKKRKST